MVGILATVCAALAALLHVGFFVMESITWTRPATWRRFGLASQEQAHTTRTLAYNQGFYNLFLAVGTAIGLILFWVGAAEMRMAGTVLVLFALGSMVAAALVLLSGGRGWLRAALIQGVLPLAGFVLFLLA